MLNVLVLGHSYVANLRRLCEDEGKPHHWENPSNARGKVGVHMHGYPGGTVKMLTAEVEAGLFFHYNFEIIYLNIRKISKNILLYDIYFKGALAMIFTQKIIFFEIGI
jgi:hypothetical protein